MKMVSEAQRQHAEAMLEGAAPVIELLGVSRVYPSRSGVVYALNDASFTIGTGEWVAITGPSGSG